jgi:hypothetical protein
MVHLHTTTSMVLRIGAILACPHERDKAEPFTFAIKRLLCYKR